MVARRPKRRRRHRSPQRKDAKVVRYLLAFVVAEWKRSLRIRRRRRFQRRGA